MRKICYLLIGFLLFNFMSVDAASCSDSVMREITSKVNQIEVKYEVIETEKPIEFNEEFMEREPDPDMKEKVDTLKTTVYNIPDNVFLVQTNDKDKNDRTIINSSKIKDGVYTFEDKNYTEIINYKYEVYTDIDNCDSSLVKTISYTKPKMNEYSLLDVCQENPDVSVCKKYVTEEIKIAEPEFVNYVYKIIGVDASKNPNEKSYGNPTTNFIKEHLVYFIGGAVLVIGVGVSAYVIISKKRSRL